MPLKHKQTQTEIGGGVKRVEWLWAELQASLMSLSGSAPVTLAESQVWDPGADPGREQSQRITGSCYASAKP